MGKPHLTTEQRGMALRLRANGLNFKEFGEQVDSSQQTAWNVVMKAQRERGATARRRRTRRAGSGAVPGPATDRHSDGTQTSRPPERHPNAERRGRDA